MRVNSLLEKLGELDALVLRVRRHLYAAEGVRLVNRLELECVDAPPCLLARLVSIAPEPNPQDARARFLLKDISFLANHLPGYEVSLPPECRPGKFGKKWRQQQNMRRFHA